MEVVLSLPLLFWLSNYGYPAVNAETNRGSANYTGILFVFRLKIESKPDPCNTARIAGMNFVPDAYFKDIKLNAG
jgi:hypothetical protein